MGTSIPFEERVIIAMAFCFFSGLGSGVIFTHTFKLELRLFRLEAKAAIWLSRKAYLSIQSLLKRGRKA